MNGRIARKKAAARNLWWWSTRRELKRERANLRRMNRKTRQACQRLSNDLGGER